MHFSLKGGDLIAFIFVKVSLKKQIEKLKLSV